MLSNAPGKTVLAPNFYSSRYLRLVLVSTILVIVIALLVFGQKTSNISDLSCGVYRNDMQIEALSQTLNAEVAITPAQRQQGLGGRPCILPNQAMLFEFNRPGQYRMWMKDMKFPIDILWLSSDRKVVAIERNVKPNTYPAAFANQAKPANYVLELKANRSKELGLGLGSQLNF